MRPVRDRENKVLEELKAAGCNVVDVTDKQPGQEPAPRSSSENTAYQAELYQQLKDFANG